MAPSWRSAALPALLAIASLSAGCLDQCSGTRQRVEYEDGSLFDRFPAAGSYGSYTVLRPEPDAERRIAHRTLTLDGEKYGSQLEASKLGKAKFHLGPWDFDRNHVTPDQAHAELQAYCVELDLGPMPPLERSAFTASRVCH